MMYGLPINFRGDFQCLLETMPVAQPSLLYSLWKRWEMATKPSMSLWMFLSFKPHSFTPDFAIEWTLGEDVTGEPPFNAVNLWHPLLMLLMQKREGSWFYLDCIHTYEQVNELLLCFQQSTQTYTELAAAGGLQLKWWQALMLLA